MGYIYTITNQINGKVYVGKTQLSFPEERWKQHLNEYKKDRNSNRPLYKAMRKYGIENFSFRIIEQNITGQELCDKQKYYIKQYKSYVGFEDCNGYNATLGGDGKPYIEFLDEEVITTFSKYTNLTLTAKELGIDPKTVREILKRNNVKYFTGQVARDYLYYMKYGGVSKVDIKSKKVIDNYRSINEVVSQNPSFLRKKIYEAIDGGNHHERYGYLWYRTIDLPDWVKR